MNTMMLDEEYKRASNNPKGDLEIPEGAEVIEFRDEEFGVWASIKKDKVLYAQPTLEGEAQVQYDDNLKDFTDKEGKLNQNITLAKEKLKKGKKEEESGLRLIARRPHFSKKELHADDVYEVILVKQYGEKDEKPESGKEVEIICKGYMHKKDLKFERGERFKPFNENIFPEIGQQSLLKEINAADVKQSIYGNCFLLVVLIGILNTEGGIDFIRRMVKQGDDGFTTVRLFDRKASKFKYIRVENTSYYLNNKDSVKHIYYYLQMIEKAYVALQQGSEGDLYPSFHVVFGNGDATNVAMEVLTGKKASSKKLKITYENPVSESCLDFAKAMFGKQAPILTALNFGKEKIDEKEEEKIQLLKRWIDKESLSAQGFSTLLKELRTEAMAEKGRKAQADLMKEFFVSFKLPSELIEIIYNFTLQEDNPIPEQMVTSLQEYINYTFKSIEEISSEDNIAILRAFGKDNVMMWGEYLNGLFFTDPLNFDEKFTELKNLLNAINEQGDLEKAINEINDKLEKFEPKIPRKLIKALCGHIAKTRCGVSGTGIYTLQHLELFKDIEEKLASGHLLASGTPPVYLDGEKPAGISSRHAYAIVRTVREEIIGEVDEKGEKRYRLYVILRNPWGETGLQNNVADEEQKVFRGESIEVEDPSAESKVELSQIDKYFTSYYVCEPLYQPSSVEAVARENDNENLLQQNQVYTILLKLSNGNHIRIDSDKSREDVIRKARSWIARNNYQFVSQEEIEINSHQSDIFITDMALFTHQQKKQNMPEVLTDKEAGELIGDKRFELVSPRELAQEEDGDWREQLLEENEKEDEGKENEKVKANQEKLTIIPEQNGKSEYKEAKILWQYSCPITDEDFTRAFKMEEIAFSFENAYNNFASAVYRNATYTEVEDGFKLTSTISLNGKKIVLDEPLIFTLPANSDTLSENNKTEQFGDRDEKEIEKNKDEIEYDDGRDKRIREVENELLSKTGTSVRDEKFRLLYEDMQSHGSKYTVVKKWANQFAEKINKKINSELANADEGCKKLLLESYTIYGIFRLVEIILKNHEYLNNQDVSLKLDPDAQQVNIETEILPDGGIGFLVEITPIIFAYRNSNIKNFEIREYENPGFILRFEGKVNPAKSDEPAPTLEFNQAAVLGLSENSKQILPNICRKVALHAELHNVLDSSILDFNNILWGNDEQPGFLAQILENSLITDSESDNEENYNGVNKNQSISINETLRNYLNQGDNENYGKLNRFYMEKEEQQKLFSSVFEIVRELKSIFEISQKIDKVTEQIEAEILFRKTLVEMQAFALFLKNSFPDCLQQGNQKNEDVKEKMIISLYTKCQDGITSINKHLAQPRMTTILSKNSAVRVALDEFLGLKSQGVDSQNTDSQNNEIEIYFDNAYKKAQVWENSASHKMEVVRSMQKFKTGELSEEQFYSKIQTIIENKKKQSKISKTWEGFVKILNPNNWRLENLRNIFASDIGKLQVFSETLKTNYAQHATELQTQASNNYKQEVLAFYQESLKRAHAASPLSQLNNEELPKEYREQLKQDIQQIIHNRDKHQIKNLLDLHDLISKPIAEGKAVESYAFKKLEVEDLTSRITTKTGTLKS